MESLTDASTPAEIHAALPTHAQLLLAAKTLPRVANVVAAIYRWRSRRKYPKGDVGVERAWREHRALYLGGGDAAAQQAAEDEEAVSGDEADEKEEPQPPAPARSATQPLAAALSVSAAPPSRAALAGRGALAAARTAAAPAEDDATATVESEAAAWNREQAQYWLAEYRRVNERLERATAESLQLHDFKARYEQQTIALQRKTLELQTQLRCTAALEQQVEELELQLRDACYARAGAEQARERAANMQADEQSQLDAAADGGQAAESAPAAAAAPAVSEHKAVGAPPAKRQKRKTEMERLAAVVLNTPRRG
jgi:hypothetical protein